VAEQNLEPLMIPEEISHFLSRIRTDSEPIVTGAMARHDLEVVLAAHRSAETGERVILP